MAKNKYLRSVKYIINFCFNAAKSAAQASFEPPDNEIAAKSWFLFSRLYVELKSKSLLRNVLWFWEDAVKGLLNETTAWKLQKIQVEDKKFLLKFQFLLAWLWWLWNYKYP